MNKLLYVNSGCRPFGANGLTVTYPMEFSLDAEDQTEAFVTLFPLLPG